MERQNLKTILEVTTNVAVLMVAMAILSVLAVYIFLKPRAADISTGLQKGQAFGAISKVDYGRSERTVLIALTTTCSYCLESLPLYQKLTSAAASANAKLQVVALFPNAANDVEKYVRENQLPVETVAAVDFYSGEPAVNSRATSVA